MLVVFTDIHNLLEQKNGEMLYKTNFGKQFYLEIFLGGDWKFLLTMMGLNAANSKYTCLYCKIDKKDRIINLICPNHKICIAQSL